MANLSLLTRPQCFGDVVGQQLVIEQVVNHLNSMLDAPDDIIQPLILAGPHGTGKTTTARLIAMYLNCEIKQNIDAPCMCGICTAIQTNPETAVDYHELDAASHNGVADVEEIIEHTFFRPIGNFKIVLFDEGHMLTKNAFNALLKQFEEPPKRVLYIIATTEEHKILPTIRSRCKIRRFGLLDDDLIYDHLSSIVKNPDYISFEDRTDYTDEVLQYATSMAQGSVRDGIKNLGEFLDLKERTLLNLQNAMGSGDVKKTGTLLRFLFEEKLGEMLIQLRILEKDGVDPKQLMEQFQNLLTDLLNVKVGSNVCRMLSPDYYKEKYDPTLNVSTVATILGSLLKTEAIARGSITYHTLTYALINAHNKTHNSVSTNIQPQPNLAAKKSVVFPPSNQQTGRKTTAADIMAQSLQKARSPQPQQTGLTQSVAEAVNKTFLTTPNPVVGDDEEDDF